MDIGGGGPGRRNWAWYLMMCLIGAVGWPVTRVTRHQVLLIRPCTRVGRASTLALAITSIGLGIRQPVSLSYEPTTPFPRLLSEF